MDGNTAYTVYGELGTWYLDFSGKRRHADEEISFGQGRQIWMFGLTVAIISWVSVLPSSSRCR